jgi:hypothetical protein
MEECGASPKRGRKQESYAENSGSRKSEGQDWGFDVLRGLAFLEGVVRQRSWRRVISSSETRVSHSSTRPDGPRCHQVEMFVGAGLAGCSTIAHRDFFQESVPFPHHCVGDCLQNVLFSEENWSNLCNKQK